MTKEQKDFLLMLNNLLPMTSTVHALAPDKGPNFRPFHLKYPLTGDQILEFRKLFSLPDLEK